MIDVSIAHTALAIPEVTEKDLFPNRHQEGMFRNDDLEVELSIILCTKF